MKGIAWNMNYMNGIERYMKCMEHELYALYVCGSVSICGNDVLLTERRLTPQQC